MKIYSLSRDLLNGVYYKSRANVELSICTKNGVTESGFYASSIHIGTHIDMPSHFGGRNKVVEPAVYEEHEVLVIDSHIVGLFKNVNKKVKLIIFNYDEELVRSSDISYSSTFRSPDMNTLKVVLENCPNTQCVATTNLSIGSPVNSAENRAVHLYLLREKKINILEDIDMTNFRKKFKYIIIQPIKMGSAEACWASVSLLC